MFIYLFFFQKGLYYSPNKELYYIQPLPKRFQENDGSSPHIIIKRSLIETKNQYYNNFSNSSNANFNNKYFRKYANNPADNSEIRIIDRKNMEHQCVHDENDDKM